MATPLHVHTEKSALDGLSKPSEIADRVEELGMESVAVTDHDFVAGHIDFYKEMDKRGIKPILGIETYQTPHPRQTHKSKALSVTDELGNKNRADNFHLILLAMNNTGLQNLWALNSESHRTGFWYNGRTDWDLLKRYNEGIICTSACGLGMIPQAIRNNPYTKDADWLMQKYLDIFGDRFYVELSTYSEDWQRNLNVMLVGLAKEWGVPLVYANDAHYASPGQYELHETVLCMQYTRRRYPNAPSHITLMIFTSWTKRR
jgi:DNA polymerase-3 subunit alpha